MPDVTVQGSKEQRRIHSRKKDMALNDQLEAVVDFARTLKKNGIDVGEKMSVMVVADDKVRSEIR